MGDPLLDLDIELEGVEMLIQGEGGDQLGLEPQVRMGFGAVVWCRKGRGSHQEKCDNGGQ
jgi:hypothetical protein